MAGRRMVKTLAVLLTLGYCSILVYQSGTRFNSLESEQVPVISIEPVTIINNYVSKLYMNITLDDIFISVKTSQHYQDTRLPIILKTWFLLAQEQIWFFTDTENEVHQTQSNGHMVNTNCSTTHDPIDLCCKLSYEYDYYIKSQKKWFCHFDDDNYVNVPQLVNVLQTYNYRKDWYLGRTSIPEPIQYNKSRHHKRMVKFWFATGGAGFCISRSLALKISPVTSRGRFINICERTGFPDDVSMGFVIEHLMKKNLTRVLEFHSHIEEMNLMDPETFRDQISFGYSNINDRWNVLKVPGFNTTYDPSRFLSLHCLLFPHFDFCPR